MIALNDPVASNEIRLAEIEKTSSHFSILKFLFYIIILSGGLLIILYYCNRNKKKYYVLDESDYEGATIKKIIIK